MSAQPSAAILSDALTTDDALDVILAFEELTARHPKPKCDDVREREEAAFIIDEANRKKLNLLDALRRMRMAALETTVVAGRRGSPRVLTAVASAARTGMAKLKAMVVNLNGLINSQTNDCDSF
jgi:hypothetical protein